MEENKSKVYVLLDGENRITCCEGGYSMSNISDIGEWTLIDEGDGDRYNLCQSHYFDSLMTDDGIYRYKYVNGGCVLRTDAEIEADRNARPAPAPTEAEQMRADLDFLLAMGGVL